MPEMAVETSKPGIMFIFSFLAVSEVMVFVLAGTRATVF